MKKWILQLLALIVLVGALLGICKSQKQKKCPVQMTGRQGIQVYQQDSHYMVKKVWISQQGYVSCWNKVEREKQYREKQSKTLPNIQQEKLEAYKTQCVSHRIKKRR